MTCAAFGKLKAIEHIELTNADLKAVNTAANPNNVAPRAAAIPSVEGGMLETTIKKASWNVLRFAVEK